MQVSAAMKQAILLMPKADDLPQLQELARQTFAHVHLPNSISACLELLGSSAVDVVLSTMKFSAILRSDPRCRNVPVITLYGPGDNLSDLFTIGLAEEVLFLPVGQDEFLFRCLKAQRNLRQGGAMERRQRDRVTGFLNAPALQTLAPELKQLVDGGKNLVLYYFAITNLQSTAQEFGASLGDALLVEIAHRLEGLAPKAGATFIRLAYSILLMIESGADKSDMASRTSVLKQAMNQPYEAAGITMKAKIEVGAALAPDDGHTPEELLQIAFAKTWGNDKPAAAPVPRFLPQQDPRQASHDAQAGRLIEALRTRLLNLDYQPIFDFDSGSIVAIEILLHWPKGKLWQQCKQTLVECNLHGLGFEGLTEAVIERATQDMPQFGKWPGPLCVNIGIDGLRLPKLAMNLARSIQSHKINPKKFQLVIQCPKGHWRRPHGIELLRDLGFSMAIDFGTNAKGANQLVSASGLAMAYVDSHMLADRDIAPLVAQVKSQGLMVIATKLENADEVSQARHVGCSGAQGYFFASPQAASAMAELLRDIANAL